MNNEPNPDELKACRYLCFRAEYGFAQYSPDETEIAYTQDVDAAHEATQSDWENVLGGSLGTHRLLTAGISVNALQRRAEALAQDHAGIRQACKVEFDTPIADDEDVVDLVGKLIVHHKEKEQQLTTAQKQIAEKDAGLRGLIDWVRAVRHSMDNNKPFPSGEKLTEHIEAAEKVISSDGSQFVHKSEVEKVQRDPEMPGAWRCPKCNFTLQKSLLYAGSGTMSADTSPLNEVCPNDGQLMRPLTWRETNEEIYKMACDRLQELTTLKQKVGVMAGVLEKAQIYIDSAKDDLHVEINEALAIAAEIK